MKINNNVTTAELETGVSWIKTLTQHRPRSRYTSYFQTCFMLTLSSIKRHFIWIHSSGKSLQNKLRFWQIEHKVKPIRLQKYLEHVLYKASKRLAWWELTVFLGMTSENVIRKLFSKQFEVWDEANWQWEGQSVSGTGAGCRILSNVLMSPPDISVSQT